MSTARVEIYQRQDHLWDFRVVAANDEELCSSLQGYTSEHDARRGYATAVLTLGQQGLEIRSLPLP